MASYSDLTYLMKRMVQSKNYKIGWPYLRNYCGPMDYSTLVDSYNEAVYYAKYDSFAYIGQIIEVSNKDDPTKGPEVYQIADAAGNLVPVGNGSIPTATTTRLGLVKVDGVTVFAAADGTLSAVGGGPTMTEMTSAEFNTIWNSIMN